MERSYIKLSEHKKNQTFIPNGIHESGKAGAPIL